MTAELRPETRPHCDRNIAIPRLGLVFCQRRPGHTGTHRALTALHSNGAEETLRWTA